MSNETRPEADIRAENDRLRGLLAWGTDPCVYCGLRASDMGKCRRGFPGCARSDDMQCAWELENWTRATPSAGASPHVGGSRND